MSDEEKVSKAEQYLASKGWRTQRAGVDQMKVSPCPFCGHTDYKFFINVGGTKRDGLWDCKACQETGNLWKLMDAQGDRMDGVQSIQELARSHDHSQPEAMPNVENCHRHLLEDQEAMDYLIAGRGYTREVIEKMRLGTMTNGFKKQGDLKCIVIPYLKNGKCIYAKYRTIPPALKEFDSPHGHDAPLFNDSVLVPGIEEVIFAEGEGDVLSLLSQGIENVVGVPGADTKKAAWITLVDNLSPKKIYILYDRDKAGQDGAYEMARRIGLQRCYNIVLPQFTYINDTGDEKEGKDVNEWFRYGGGTAEAFALQKSLAKKFDVAGTTSMSGAIEKLRAQLVTRGTIKKEFDTPWPSGNKKGMGGERGNLIVVMAEEKRGKTTIALNWADYLWSVKHMSGGFFCLEMTAEELARKWVCYVTKTPDDPAKDDEDAILKAGVLLEAIDKGMEIARSREQGDLLFGYSRASDADEVFDIMEQAIRRYGLDYIVFDNLQLFVDSTIGRNFTHRTAFMSQISKRFKKLATDFGVLVILVVQPHRVQDGKIIDANNADGGSQIQKDCDQFITLHRNLRGGMEADDWAKLGYIDDDLTFDPQTMVKLARSRTSGGGCFTLWCEGNMSWFREMTSDEWKQPTDTTAKMTTVPQENLGAPIEA